MVLIQDLGFRLSGLGIRIKGFGFGDQILGPTLCRTDMQAHVGQSTKDGSPCLVRLGFLRFRV